MSYNFRFGGIVKSLGHTYVTDDFGFTRRPYQMFLPVCESDLSGCTVGREEGPLAISIPSARPVLHDVVDLQWAHAMQFEGYCKNLFWFVSELYEFTDFAKHEIPIFVGTNAAGESVVRAYARACQFPQENIIVHPNKFLRRQKESHLPHGIKFDMLAHDRLQHFERVLHIDASERVRGPAPHIWDRVMNEWDPEKQFAHGRPYFYGMTQDFFSGMSVELLQEITGIQDEEELQLRFYHRETHPHCYGQVFGGRPDFWRNPRLREVLWAAEQHLYGDEWQFGVGAVAVGLEEVDIQPLDWLVNVCIQHMEPFHAPYILRNEWQFGFFGKFFEAIAFCHERHGKAFHMIYKQWDSNQEEPA